MRRGTTSCRSSTSAAATPAGPAPMMTTSATARKALGRAGQQAHAGARRRRAGAEPSAIGAPDPAILAGAHQAEACALLAVELEQADVALRAQHRRQHALARLRRDRAAIEADLDRGTAKRCRAPELARLRFLRHQPLRPTARRRSSSAAITKAVTNTRITVETAAKVGFTCSSRSFHICRGKVALLPPVMKSATVKSSNEVMNANRKPAMTPPRICGS